MKQYAIAKNRPKRRVCKAALAAALLALCFVLPACQPTPEVPPLVNRGEGLGEAYVLPPTPEGKTKEIDAPAHWKETLERRDGAIRIEADVDVIVPEVANTPVLELKQVELTEGRLQELVAYFAGGSKLYERPRLTKTQLQGLLDMAENKYGEFNAPYANSMGDLMGYKERIGELLETAPDGREKVDTDARFAEPVQSDARFIWAGEEKDEQKADNTFEAWVEAANGPDPMVSATRYDTAVGSASGFTYCRGFVYTEEDAEKDQETLDVYSSWQQDAIMNQINSVDDAWIGYKTNMLESMRAAMEGAGVDEQAARAQADQLLKELGIEGMGLAQTQKGAQFMTEDYGLSLFDPAGVDFSTAKAGWSFTYFREAGGLTACTLNYGFGMISSNFESANELPGAPPFFAERVELFVTDEGVQRFGWENMSQPVRVVAENTALLPFEEITERYADYVNFNSHPAASDRLAVQKVELRLAYAPAMDAPGHAWLVPVWVFEHMRDYVREGGGYSVGLGQCQFNAIDGGNLPTAGGMYYISE